MSDRCSAVRINHIYSAMKKFFAISAIAATLLIGLNLNAVTPITPTSEDWTSFLEDNGYHLYSFNVSEFADTTRYMVMTVREYEFDSIVTPNIALPYWLPTRKMLTDIPEDVREGFMSDMEDAEKGIVSSIKKFNIGIYSPGDSTAKFILNAVGTVRIGGDLNLKPISTSKEGKRKYMYIARPFAACDTLPEDRFIPLVFFSSFWVDENGIIRSCGENELKGLNSELIKLSPHSFVVGIEIH